MLLLIDENVPGSASDVSRARGQWVYPVYELFLPSTPDEVIVLAGDQQRAIVVTWNHKDFKRLATRIPVGERLRFRHLGRINFRCNEAHGRQRAADLIEWMELEFAQVQKRSDKRLTIEIGETSFRVIR